MTGFANLSKRPLPWLLLLIGAAVLYVLALYFQYGMGLEPCVKCIYQRTAVLGIMAAGFVGVLGYGVWPTRWAALALWLYSSVQGFIVAYDHWDLQTSKNAFFAVCESHPNFPQWLPLHEWLPGLFAAPGLCGDIDWQFLGLGMPGWMMVIFAAFTVLAGAVCVSQLLFRNR